MGMFFRMPGSLPPDSRWEGIRYISDGKYVAVQSRFAGSYPPFGGMTAPFVWLDLFRIENGKFVEHWDALCSEVTSTMSGHGQLDGPTQVMHPQQGERSKAVVDRFIRTVLIDGHDDRLGEFFDGERYIEHDPMSGDGVTGLLSTRNQLAQRGIRVEYTELHRLIADGEFVLAQSEGRYGDKPYAFYDIFRVEGDKLAEHWDIPMQQPATLAHTNGLF